MRYLLDTNVISEIRKPEPDRQVLLWLNATGISYSYISVITLGEVRKGIEKLPAGRRRDALMQWLEHTIPEWFAGRIYSIDFNIADTWGRIIATRSTKNDIDMLIAATALVHGFTLVTRNTKDFTIPGLTLFNPWEYKA